MCKILHTYHTKIAAPALDHIPQLKILEDIRTGNQTKSYQQDLLISYDADGFFL